MPLIQDAVELFKRNAASVSMRTVEAGDLREAAEYALRAALARPPARRLLPGVGPAPEGARTVFFAGLPDDCYAEVAERARAEGVRAAREGARAFAGGLEVAFSLAFLAAADTASLALDFSSEDARLAPMLAETHVVAVPRSMVTASLEEALPLLVSRTRPAGAWTELVSGSSRTSDIERVLTLGVHGPLELHAVICG
ncbi:MAG: lactate utilization protein [Deltaproteobacteria bacterium]|jgi:L-lactate dehydrogenase complex protein LldG|nr:lactate utilization protein [Deltaproteobacteria bacterium]